MTNELIKIKRNEEGQQLVSARELYLGLGLSKTQWSRWFKKNILKNEFFKKNIDYVGVRHDVEGNDVQDFAITLEFAKHITMMARTEKSHEYRNYFIECEKELKSITKQDSYMIQDPVKRAKRWIEEEEERQRLLLLAKENQEKANKFDVFLNADGLCKVADFAKMIGMGRNKLYEKLRDAKILMADNIPYQKYMKYFEVKNTVKYNRRFKVVLINKRGLDFLSNKLNIA